MILWEGSLQLLFNLTLCRHLRQLTKYICVLSISIQPGGHPQKYIAWWSFGQPLTIMKARNPYMKNEATNFSDSWKTLITGDVYISQLTLIDNFIYTTLFPLLLFCFNWRQAMRSREIRTWISSLLVLCSSILLEGTGLRSLYFGHNFIISVLLYQMREFILS